MTAFFLLTLTPYLVVLSVQLRNYTLALFLVAACLLVLDRAMESRRWETMALFSVLLWAVRCVPNYSTAWFVGAVGVFVLIRLRHLSKQGRDVWIAGQIGAVILYALLFLIQVARYRGNSVIALDAIDGWLRNEFSKIGQLADIPVHAYSGDSSSF